MHNQSSLSHELSSEIGCGNFRLSQPATSAGSNRGAVDSICQRTGFFDHSSGVGLNTVGSIISSDIVFRNNPNLRMTGHAIGDAISTSKLTHQ